MNVKLQFKKSIKKLRFRERLFFTMLFIGMLASFAAVISAVIANLDIYGLLSSAACFLFWLLMLGYIYVTQNFHRAEIMSCLGFCFIFFPLNFIFSGGLSGGMPMYFVSGAVIIKLLMPRRTQTFLQILYFLSCSALFVFAHNYPQYITPYESAEMQLYDMIMSLGITTTMIGWCVNALLYGYEAEHKKLERLNLQLTEMAIRDGLTNLYNRRYLMSKLEHYMQTAEKDKRKLSLVMFDIDFFKQINDTYGHQAGDEVLRNFSYLLDRYMDEDTLVGRYGGEEFVLVLLDRGPDEAYVIAENIRSQVEKSILAESVQRRVTVSGGVSSLRESCMDISKLISTADDNLYRAKECGRNQIISCL